MAMKTEIMSGAFAWRRIHSLMGLWLIIYLIEHLIVNSQATLWLGDDGIGFVRLVNLLEALPYLQVIEIVFIGVPFLLHGIWGVKRIFTSKRNIHSRDGSSPSLGYERNRAYSWQRLTSWILLIGVLGHVAQMRFLLAPKEVRTDTEIWYTVPLKEDPGLGAVAKRLNITLEPQGDEILAKAKSPGKAFLMMVRETFKSPFWCILYTVFVLAASFHAFNGFWTSLITWGVLLSYRAQRAFLPICWTGVGLLAFLGLAAIWGSYWINLRN
ncbi:MAG: succinate dehydrogenase [Verrucomicrobia bacterium]|nr:succinate dehydrogenase [Verrucomicrobiota bacterium]MBU6446728.1 succinate dehydrogenase [Verrucomicrobiota bacterium]MDE3047728.1 succinate dehydrogenase [Verrucomicrobiota bacterium]